MNAITVEFLKLKRSLSWAVVILLPMVMVIAGSVMSLVDGQPLDDGWHTLWLRSTVFYGLFPLAVGIAILASLVWRVEHRGSNWNSLMSGPTSSLRLVVAKATVVAVLAAVMQFVLVVTILVMGKFAFGLPGLLPAEYLWYSVLIALASAPVAALQSGLSIFMHSFAAPIAVAFLAAGFSTGLLIVDAGVVIFVSPYALLTRVTQLGTNTFADVGPVTGGDITVIVVATVVLTGIVLAATTVILNRRDIRL